MYRYCSLTAEAKIEAECVIEKHLLLFGQKVGCGVICTKLFGDGQFGSGKRNTCVIEIGFLHASPLAEELHICLIRCGERIKTPACVSIDQSDRIGARVLVACFQPLVALGLGFVLTRIGIRVVRRHREVDPIIRLCSQSKFVGNVAVVILVAVGAVEDKKPTVVLNVDWCVAVVIAVRPERIGEQRVDYSVKVSPGLPTAVGADVGISNVLLPLFQSAPTPMNRLR